MPPQFCNKNDLTVARLKINLSASVDGTGLIQSGRGTGPMTPRQPVAARSAMTRCQFQLKRLAWERGEERAFFTSARPDEKGFFIDSKSSRDGRLAAPLI